MGLQELFQSILCLTLITSLQCVSNSTDGPACDVLQENNLLTCYLIDNSNVDVILDALKKTENWTEVAVAFTSTDVKALPDDIFQDVLLTKLIFSYNTTMNNIPNGILKQISSPLDYLEFTNVVGITSVSKADFDQVLFSSDLEVLILKTSELRTIEGSSFEQFDALEALSISNTQIPSLPTDMLHGLTALEELTLTYNPITSVPRNFFIEQSQLKNIWLGQNKLEFIENGALDGLDNVQMLSVPGNPFHCNCSLQWFKDWLTDKNILDASGATCSFPSEGPFSTIEFCS